MNEWLKNRLVLVVVASSVVLWLFVLQFMFLTNTVKSRVINELRQNYSPSPYGPGFDPDKVNPQAFKTMLTDLDRLRSEVNTLDNQDEWYRLQWEKERMGLK